MLWIRAIYTTKSSLLFPTLAIKRTINKVFLITYIYWGLGNGSASKRSAAQTVRPDLNSDPPREKRKEGNRKIPGACWQPILTNQWAPDLQKDCQEKKKKMGKVGLTIQTYNIFNYSHKVKTYSQNERVLSFISARVPMQRKKKKSHCLRTPTLYLSQYFYLLTPEGKLHGSTSCIPT